MWLILQQDKPDDFVIATGESRSVREFVEEVFGYLNMDWHKYVEVDPKYFRPTEVDTLQGDATKAAKVLGWKPKVAFRELAKMMTDADMKIAEHEKIIAEHDRKQ